MGSSWVLSADLRNACIVRALSATTSAAPRSFRSPFVVAGAPNVFLETIKRGEADDFSSSSSTSSVILRLYEAFGGHASATLLFGAHLPVVKAVVTNMLEDEGEDAELDIAAAGGSVRLEFRGFEIKTVKLVLGKGRAKEWVVLLM